MSAARPVLTASYVLEYTYRRSVGPVLGQFLAGLRDARVLGARTLAGRVLVPPVEYDSDTGEAEGGLVEVGQAGEVTMCSWVDRPQPSHRVKAEWVPPAERRPTLESVRWFRPNGEPDAPFDAIREHL